MLVTSENIKALSSTLSTEFQTEFDASESTQGMIAMQVPSSSASNSYAWLGEFPGMREWLGDRVINDLASHDYSIKNKKFESTFKIGREAIEDDAFGFSKLFASGLGTTAAKHPDEVVYDVVSKGFTNPCYDGVSFFSESHKNGKGTKSNLITGSAPAFYLIDGSRSIKPFVFQMRRDYNFVSLTSLDSETVMKTDSFLYGVDARVAAGYGLWQLAAASKTTLTEASYLALKTLMTSQKAENGKPIMVRPTILLVGPSNEAAAKEVILRERNANGETNVYMNDVEIIVSPYLA